MVPGIVVVWSGSQPRFEAIRIGENLVFGRELIAETDDDRVSREHVRLEVGTDGGIIVTDLGSRNGTYLQGEVLSTPTRARPLAIARTGRTVFVLVDDVRAYEHIPLSRRDDLVIGGSLDKPVRELDIAALDGANVALVGPLTVMRALARSYLAKLGGEHVVFDQPRQLLLESVVESFAQAGGRPRAIVLELTAPLQPGDVAYLATWLETDVRCVTCIRTGAGLTDLLPPELRARLAERAIHIPRFRFDELPATFVAALAAIAPAATLHASAVEHLLLETATTPEDIVLATFEIRAANWRYLHPDRTTLRGDDLVEQAELRGPDGAWCIFPRGR